VGFIAQDTGNQTRGSVLIILAERAQSMQVNKPTLG